MLSVPERGEVWQVDFGITQKVRPALVISIPYADVDRALIGIIPHTRAIRGSQFEVSVLVRFLTEGAFRRFHPNIFCAALAFYHQTSSNVSRMHCCVGRAFLPNDRNAEPLSRDEPLPGVPVAEWSSDGRNLGGFESVPSHLFELVGLALISGFSTTRSKVMPRRGAAEA
jgi:hypothetical protein